MNASADSLRRELTSIRNMTPAERSEAILASERAAELVRALPPQDLYLTLAESDPQSALAVLPLATRAQVDFVLDLDAWSGDVIDVERTGRWLDLLHQADPALLLRFLRETDEEFVVLALSKLLFVTKADESTSMDRWPPEDRQVATLDGIYFIEPQDDAPDAAFPALWEALARLREADRPVYEALLERVMWIVPAEQEEDAYERRASRLAEHGFPPLDEAREVWAAGHLADPAWRARVAERLALLPLPGAGGGEGESDGEEPVLPVAVPRNELERLGDALPWLDDARREAIGAALVRLGNRFAVTSGDHLGNPETHRDGLVRALSHVLVGLDELGAKDARSAARALIQVPIVEICRVGTGAIQERVARARALVEHGWLARVPHGRARLEEPLDAVLVGLLAERPRFAADGADRPFRATADLERLDEVLGAIEGLGTFVIETLGTPDTLGLGDGRDVPELTPLPDRREDPRECAWSEIALTAIAQASLGRPPRPVPIGRDDARRALALLLTDEIPRTATPRAHDIARDLRLGDAISHVLARLEADASDLPADDLPDTRFFSAFLFRL